MVKNEKIQLVVSSPIGPLGVRVAQGRINGIEFLDRRSRLFAATDAFSTEITRQLTDYFNASVSAFSLPLDLHGTEFQRRVWQVLARIKPGQVRTYGDIARELNTSPRAVGNACRSNPVPIIIPCHRVISASGIGGFAGTTSGRRLDTKRWLLAHEGVCL